MTIEEVIKYIKSRLLCDDCNGKGKCSDKCKAIEVIEALEQIRWIPVSERPPEENKTVIASTKFGVYPEARYTKENGWEWAYESGANYWEELEYVEAWMPLPKRYEPQESEELNNDGKSRSNLPVS